jgi:aminomethyltransferase
MIAFQGPLCAEVLEKLREAGRLPDPARNSLSGLTLCGRPVRAARTGYTGEPVGFELFMAADAAAAVWDGLHREGTRRGMLAAGLGARDTLRLEARMPLYGHELGADPEGREMPAFAFPLARAAVSFAERKGDFIGRDALALQLEAAKRIADGGAAGDTLPRRVLPLAVLDPGVARRGDPLFRGGSKAGVITSGTTVPYWEFDGRGAAARITGRSALRAIALACVDSSLKPGDPLEAEVRGRRLRTLLVGRHGRGDVPPFFQPELAGATGG